MAKNYRQDDDIITVTAPEGGVKSGAGVVLGALFGIAGADAAEGELFAARLRSPEAMEAFMAFSQKRAPDFSKLG